MRRKKQRAYLLAGCALSLCLLALTSTVHSRKEAAEARKLADEVRRSAIRRGLAIRTQREGDAAQWRLLDLAPGPQPGGPGDPERRLLGLHSPPPDGDAFTEFRDRRAVLRRLRTDPVLYPGSSIEQRSNTQSGAGSVCCFLSRGGEWYALTADYVLSEDADQHTDVFHPVRAETPTPPVIGAMASVRKEAPLNCGLVKLRTASPPNRLPGGTRVVLGGDPRPGAEVHLFASGSGVRKGVVAPPDADRDRGEEGRVAVVGTGGAFSGPSDAGAPVLSVDPEAGRVALVDLLYRRKVDFTRTPDTERSYYIPINSVLNHLGDYQFAD